MDDENIKKHKENFSGFFFKGSVFVLTLGFLFTLGESTYLSYTYLNTFTYVDFLLKAVLVIPFVLFLVFAFAALSRFVVMPFRALIRVREASKKDGRNTKEIYLSLVNAITWLLALLLVPVLVLSPFIWANNIIESLVIVYVLILLLLYIERKTKQYSVKEELKFTEELKNRVGDVFEIQKLIGMCLLAFISGSIYIQLQNTDKPNAIIALKSTHKEIEVTILTSNSNVLAVSRDNHLEIIPRNELELIRYIKKFKY